MQHRISKVTLLTPQRDAQAYALARVGHGAAYLLHSQHSVSTFSDTWCYLKKSRVSDKCRDSSRTPLVVFP